jgi:hypothetical protein
MRAWLPLLCCPFLSGCFGFAYPSVSETPAVTVRENDVRAFRLISDWTMSGPWMTGPIQNCHSIEELPITQETVEGQQDSYFAYYYLIFPVLNGSRTRTVEVLLYRPGYETVEIPAQSRLWAWFAPKRVQAVWKPAPDLAAQEKALERIVCGYWHHSMGKATWQFAAQEYTRLAQSPLAAGPEMQKTRERLLAKARECEESARKQAE